MDVALELEYFMKKKGATGLSFDSIVASGKRSSLPHGVASDKIIEDGDFLTLDFGCVYNGYCSDMTRTIVVGKASERQKEIYNIVLNAQMRALENIKPGMTGFELDKIARDVIIDAGYGEYFGHGLGHGVGLEVHEMPNVNPNAQNTLLPGMIITDEPGIYIPDFGGVRIEDLIVITINGYEVLSSSTKKLIELSY
jgi:Xaa-Pro aminopeptidase